MLFFRKIQNCIVTGKTVKDINLDFSHLRSDICVYAVEYFIDRRDKNEEKVFILGSDSIGLSSIIHCPPNQITTGRINLNFNFDKTQTVYINQIYVNLKDLSGKPYELDTDLQIFIQFSYFHSSYQE